MNLTAIKQNISLYSLLAVLVGAQGAILVFVHHFGNSGVDVVCGSVLAGVATLAVVGHGFLNTLVIAVPANVYSMLLKINGAAVTVLAAGGMIVQYVGSVSPSLTPWVSMILQGLALVVSLFAQAFKVSATKKVAALAVVK